MVTNLNILNAGWEQQNLDNPERQQVELNTPDIRPTYNKLQPASHIDIRLFATFLDPGECGDYLVPFWYCDEICWSS